MGEEMGLKSPPLEERGFMVVKDVEGEHRKAPIKRGIEGGAAGGYGEASCVVSGGNTNLGDSRGVPSRAYKKRFRGGICGVGRRTALRGGNSGVVVLRVP